eukprot:CAMPEP_0170734240 /NCGR_PEP_ID=MMETSP0437-20130122/2490_1 /TAXON_ID=0 /ORGANISM="Sexangularia sp." /LENGTH=380 /DNA_ID=CAMNT_0011072551 /DNA_START=1 /DNA_END=1144 /DNA_ORIENTATION=-
MGIAVAVVIHQPRREIVQLFDQLVLLAGGAVVYRGPVTREAVTTAVGSQFQVPTEDELADYLLDHANELPPLLEPMLEADGGGQGGGRSSLTAGPPSPARPFSSSRGSAVASHRVALSLAIGLATLVGSLYAAVRFVGPPLPSIIAQCPTRFLPICSANQSDTLAEQASMVALSLSLVAAAAGLRVFGGTEAQARRHMVHWPTHTSLYWAAATLVSLPLDLVMGFSFAAVFSLLATPVISGVRISLLLTGLSCAASGAGHLVGAAVADGRTMLVTVLLIAANTLVGGVSPPTQRVASTLGSFGASFLRHLTWVHYTVEGYYIGVTDAYDEIYSVSGGRDLFDFSSSNRNTTIVSLFAMGLLFRILTLAALLRRRATSSGP